MLPATLTLTVVAVLLPVVSRAQWRDADEPGKEAAFEWVQEILDHAETITQQAHDLATALQENALKSVKRDGADDVADLVETVGLKVQEEQQKAAEATEALLQKIDSAKEDLDEAFRTRRSANPDFFSTMADSYTAALPGLQQMNEQ